VQGRPDVFAYLDYREYLRDYFAFGKVRHSLSHRTFARRARFASPSFVKLVMEGRRNLSASTAVRVASACHLEDREAEYFTRLVAFTQARDTDTRRAAYDRLTSFTRWRRIHALDLASDAYHAHWYLPAIRELAATESFVPDPKWIASQLRPRIRTAQARAALRTLVELGLLREDARGRLRQTRVSVTSGVETGSLHMAEFHRAMMQRASASIDLFPREQRDVGSVTLCVDDETLTRLKSRIQEMRRELLDEEATARSRTRVVQINIQLFPLSESVAPPTRRSRRSR
jgi:uncharacterized protein (TIGR02147 family)